MTDVETPEELPPPEVGIRVVYLGPVAPHWEIQGLYGEQAHVDEFRRRTMARLQLLPPHDPQFRRNRARRGARELRTRVGSRRSRRGLSPGGFLSPTTPAWSQKACGRWRGVWWTRVTTPLSPHR